MKSKYPVQIMVFEVVTSNDDVMSLFIFPNAPILNMDVGLRQVLGLRVAMPHKYENPVLAVN